MLTVIIPTFQRKNVLEKCLWHLSKSNFTNPQINNFEVLVVEDGGRDSEDLVRNFKKSLKVRYFSQDKKGQGAARNLAIEEARGDVLVFIGDDIWVSENFLQEHLTFHSENKELNQVCIGLTNFHPDLQNSFLRWLENYGFQFDFYRLIKKKKASFWHFYTSNISLKKDFLGSERFDESFSSYGFEDIELGFRLERQKKMQIKFNSRARAFHWHLIKKEDFYHRMKSAGQAAWLFESKHPGVGAVPAGWKMKLQKLLIVQANLFSCFREEWRFYAQGKRAFLEGIEEMRRVNS